MLYRICTVCGKNVPYGDKCKCEIDRQKQNYRYYRENRKDKKEQNFYNNKYWEKCKESVKAHQFAMDLIEWDKGNSVEAEVYHHIIPIKEEWNIRLDKDNIIGLTKQNHIRVHRIMDRNLKDKLKVQKYLKSLIEKFEKEFY